MVSGFPRILATVQRFVFLLRNENFDLSIRSPSLIDAVTPTYHAFAQIRPFKKLTLIC